MDSKIPADVLLLLGFDPDMEFETIEVIKSPLTKEQEDGAIDNILSEPEGVSANDNAEAFVKR